MDFSQLHLASLLGSLNQQPQQQLPTPQPFPTMAPPEPSYDPGADFSSLYQPQNQAQDLFMQVLQQYPQLQNPTKLRKIGGFLAGLGSKTPFETSFQAAHGPELAQQQQWNERIKPLQQAADNERQSNLLGKQVADTIVNRKQQQFKIEETERKDKATEQVRQQRADVYQFKALNPDAKFDFRGPTVLVADPLTGKVTDTKVPTGSLSDMDKLNLQHENRLGEIAAQGAQSRATKGMPSGTPRNQLIQPLDENGKPNGPPVRVNMDTGQVTPVDIKGFTKAPPRAASSSTTVTTGPTGTTTRKTTPGVAPMTRTVRNKKTGEIKQQTSTDGGVTWKFQ